MIFFFRFVLPFTLPLRLAHVAVLVSCCALEFFCYAVVAFHVLVFFVCLVHILACSWCTLPFTLFMLPSWLVCLG